MRILLLACSLLLTSSIFAQTTDEATIRDLLQKQQEDWNRGNIEAFMQGYWQSDSLMFIGSSGVTYGFKNTWERYKKNYDSRDKMGELKFDLLHVNRLANDVYMVVGKWHLKRTVGDVGGIYTLILRKISGKWVITSDHTS
ncbi:YybH family protein [Flavihumibacter sp.]|uniref:YybH family protein n=1 Tax=Flavihumibacter sp. TaxID=1913981 RepID=UPI002FCAF1B8